VRISGLVSMGSLFVRQPKPSRRELPA
jgi:hypothetical protein